MIQKFRRFITVGVVGLSMLIPGALPMLVGGGVSAATVSGTAGGQVASGLCSGINAATGGSNGCSGGTSGSDTLSNIAKVVINIFSVIVGIVSVIMIIFGGFRYVTSGGASDKVGGAKNTLIYAIIGLVIVALAQTIVHFVLDKATGSVSGTTA